jgi:arylsulfatase A-like enzyme
MRLIYSFFMTILLWFAASTVFGAEPSTPSTPTKSKKPNIIYMMLDEWGYYEMSGLGHQKLKTPVFDDFRKEAMRFTQCYAGGPTCGPTRSTLLTGQHLGHVSMRSNGGATPIREDEVTIADILKDQGYATAGFGKWGIGARGTTGVPEIHGFDLFFGYYDQVHAHSFYPTFLIRNSEEVPLKGNTGHPNHGETHAQYVIFDETMKWLDKNHDKPFFLYLPYTPPHGQWGLAEDDPYWQVFKDKPWRVGQKTDKDSRMYAAMLLMVNDQLKQIMVKLKQCGIDDNTIIFLCGDNGGAPYFKSEENPRGLFAPNVDPRTGQEFRGGKGSLYEGGLRVPMMVRWPGKIKPGSQSDLVWYFPDIMPTLAELTGAKVPEACDGISIVPTLFGKGLQKQHEFLYWEYMNQYAVRMGRWKTWRHATAKKTGISWQLYDLSNDVGETTDLADKHPDIVAKIDGIAKREHTEIRRGGRLPNATVDAGRDRTVALGRAPKKAAPKRPRKAPKKGKATPGK